MSDADDRQRTQLPYLASAEGEVDVPPDRLLANLQSPDFN